jgi:hypothetical protein
LEDRVRGMLNLCAKTTAIQPLMRSLKPCQNGSRGSLLVAGFQTNDFGTGQQVTAKAVEISLKSRTFEVVVQVAGIGWNLGLQRGPSFAGGFCERRDAKVPMR